MTQEPCSTIRGQVSLGPRPSPLGLCWLLASGLALTGLSACDGSGAPPDGSVPDANLDPSLVTFRFDPDGEGFYRMPWPSDARLTADGTPDLGDFPRRSRITEPPLAEVEARVRGFATMPVVYLALRGGIEASSIPQGLDALAEDSPLQLLDLSIDGCGARLPIEAAFAAEGDDLRDDDMLQVANAIGTVLTPGHPYGLVVLRSFGSPEGRSTPRPAAFDAALRDETGATPLSASLEPLRRCGASAGLELDGIALATVFTPQDPAEEMQRLRDFVMDAGLETREVREWRRSDGYSRRGRDIETYYATVEMPMFQEGESPYESEGGGLVFDDEGVPVVQRWEDVPVAVAWGRLDDPPEGPRPVLVFEDGTGWTPWGHLGDNWIREALAAGYVVMSFMPQFHGGRAGFDGNTDLTTFNVPNPPAARANFRQQAAEISYFTRVIRERIAELDGLPPIAPDRMVYGGHSQGALTGAIVAGVETEFDAYVLNGLSSFLTLTILTREDLLDFAAVVSLLYGYSGELNRFSPLLQLLQMGGEVVDPHNFVARWHGSLSNPSGNHVFVVNGYEDDTTTPRGIEHMTMAADMPPIAPPGWDVDPVGVWDGEAVSLPVMGNERGLDDAPITLATFLRADTGHGTIYRRAQAREMAITFWDSSHDGVPVLASDAEYQCGDGADDDRDGDIDCDDEDCAALAPCAESRCDDGEDDDGDGLIDCDDDQCSAASACAETSCGDGDDNDNDGDTDCDDSDCAARAPCVEAACTDNADDDGDGDVDCDDSDCAFNGACRERFCVNGDDDDGDGAVDCEDSDCAASPGCPETACTGGVDDDGDGLVDCDDPNCASASACASTRETNCTDGLDEDGDGGADCQDADCAFSALCAAATCADGVIGRQTGVGLFSGTLEGRSNDYPPGDCISFGAGDDTPDVALAWTAPAAGTYLVSTAGSEVDTVLSVIGPSCDPSEELACDDDETPITTSSLELTVEEGQPMIIVIGAYRADQVGAFTLHIVPAP